MCGRFACNLGPDVLRRACSYYDVKAGRYEMPEWRDHPTSRATESSEDSAAAYSSAESSAESAALSAAESPPSGRFYPSANIAPSKFTPVLFHDASTGKRVLQPMKWGLIPVWHKGSAKSLRLSTINCRLEGMARSRLWRHPLSHRRLCAIVAQGFYEWRQPKNKMPKQPYFVFMSQPDSKFSPDAVADEKVWKQSTWNESQGWTGPRLVFMAGVCDIWHDVDGNPVYSYSIITTPSDRCMNWLHHRMPAVLETPEEIEAWLNPREDATVDEMLSVLKPIPITALDWFLVSNKVNSVRYQDADCAKPLVLEETKTEGKENKEDFARGAKQVGEEKVFELKIEEPADPGYHSEEKDMGMAEKKKSKMAAP